jgi:hypothetical protein
MDEEFTNFGQHYSFPYIPKDELWIEKETKTDEQLFFIDHLLVEHRLMARGVPYDKALVEADRVEKRERRRAGDVRRLTHQGKDLPDGHEVHVRLWKKLENGVSVWIVNGRLVRSGLISFLQKAVMIMFMNSFQKAKSGSMMLLKKKKEDMFYSTNFTNAIVWPVVGLITKLTQNRVALNIVAATILTNSMKR